MPINNNAIYDAVIAGATGGAVTARWLTDPISADYLDIKTKVQVIAASVDADIPAIVGGASQQQADLMQSITAGVLSQYPITDNYTQVAAAIAALFLEINAALIPGAGGGNPLSNVRFVDHGISASGNGSIASPFKTIGEAITDCPEFGLILITSGTYAEDLAVIKTLNIQAMSPQTVGNATDLSLKNPNVNVQHVTISAGKTLTALGLKIILLTCTNSTCTALLERCWVISTTGLTSDPAIDNVGGEVGSGGMLQLHDTLITGTIITNSIQGYNCIISSELIDHLAGPNPFGAYFRQTRFTDLTDWEYHVAPAGIVDLDQETNEWWVQFVNMGAGSVTISGNAANLQLFTPASLVAAGAGGFTTFLTYNALALDVKHKLEIGVDATVTDANTPATPVVGELRANRTYYITGGVLTLLNDSTVFSDVKLQLIISGTDLLLQGAFNAAGGHTLNYVGSIYAKVIKTVP